MRPARASIVLLTLAVVLLCAAPSFALGGEERTAAECTGPVKDPVCEYLAAQSQAAPVSESTSTLPGAIQPLPVNPTVEAEFWANVDQRRARGKLATAYSGPSLTLLVPSLQAGSAGWCLTVRIASHTARRCGIDPMAGSSIAWEGWEAGATGTEGYLLTDSTVTEVAIDEGPAVEKVRPVIGFAGGLSAAVVEIPAAFPVQWSDEFEVVNQGFRESGERGLSAPARAPSTTLAATPWSAPAVAPAGACALSARHLRGLRAVSGAVLNEAVPTPEVADRGLLSCASTLYSLHGSKLQAAILLDAAEPGVHPPVALPGARAFGHAPRLYRAPGAYSTILARRAGAAWLLVEGGSSRAQRESVLAQLRARITA